MLLRYVLIIVLWLSLAALILAPILFLLGNRFTLDEVKTTLLIATIVWFSSVIIKAKIEKHKSW
ncbi:MAG: hypothetical protein JW709_00430 [Sedimentisphaerales bacterium]|nr:hypothetical protein [Sedimentisphaerales bacterium]